MTPSRSTVEEFFSYFEEDEIPFMGRVRRVVFDPCINLPICRSGADLKVNHMGGGRARKGWIVIDFDVARINFKLTYYAGDGDHNLAASRDPLFSMQIFKYD